MTKCIKYEAGFTFRKSLFLLKSSHLGEVILHYFSCIGLFLNDFLSHYSYISIQAIDVLIMWSLAVVF